MKLLHDPGLMSWPSPFSVLSHNDSFRLDLALVLAFIKHQFARYHRIRIDSQCFEFMQVRSHDVQSARSVVGRCRCMHLGELISGHSLPSDWILQGRMIFLAHTKLKLLLSFGPFFLHACRRIKSVPTSMQPNSSNLEKASSKLLLSEQWLKFRAVQVYRTSRNARAPVFSRRTCHAQCIALA